MRMSYALTLAGCAGLLTAAPFATGPARAAEPPASAAPNLPSTLSRTDEQAIRTVVQGQLDAFAADDAAAAFAFASPAIREQFGTAARFMNAVKAGYPVVYRPAHVVFLKPESWADGVVQGVRMTDADGVEWLATYRVSRQPDRRWRIDGCVVAPDRSVGT